jgi:hypothetical protein
MGTAGNVARRAAMHARPPGGPAFSWVVAPVLNGTTRLAVEMSAAGCGEMAVRGYEYAPLRGVCEPATHDFYLHASSPSVLAA